MPAIENCDLYDFAVLLPAIGYERHGRINVSDIPQEITCRWEENVVSEPMKDTDVAGVTATVYVDQNIDLSSILWHGRLANFPRDWKSEAEGLMEVANFHTVPDLDGREVRRWVDAVRFRDALPAQV